MKNIFLKLSLGIMLLGSMMANVFADSYKLFVPPVNGQADIIATGSPQIESNESTIFDVIQIINDYLWFSIAGVAMVVLIFAGIKLMVARGNKEDTAAATRMITATIVAIFASMLSYAAIKLIINLF